MTEHRGGLRSPRRHDHTPAKPGYEKKRPSGLVLDASGAFTVANLLDVWGRALCLTEAGVMAAAKKHMFKDSSGTALTPHSTISHLRVAICIANVLGQCWHNASL